MTETEHATCAFLRLDDKNYVVVEEETNDEQNPNMS